MDPNALKENHSKKLLPFFQNIGSKLVIQDFSYQDCPPLTGLELFLVQKNLNKCYILKFWSLLFLPQPPMLSKCYKLGKTPI